MRVIAFSLWGNNPKYTVGAVRNAELATEIYPGWQCRFYHGTSVPSETLRRLDGFSHVKLINIGTDGNWTCMFDRFRPASEPDVELMISRDCDSRLSLREAVAVNEWIGSPYDFHTIHDHAHHTVPILGGLWGIKRHTLPEFGVLLKQWHKENRWQTDQEFLTQIIWPKVCHITMNHAEFHTNIWPGKLIPMPRSGRTFIGATYDENDVIDSEQQRLLYDGHPNQKKI